MWIGFKPTTSEGRTVVALIGGAALMAGLVGLYLGKGHPMVVVAALVLAFVVYFVGLAIAFFKMEDHF